MPGDYGDRTTVTAVVTRGGLPSLCADLHNLLGVDVGRHPDNVLLPADTRSFGLVAGASGTPAQGVIENLPKRAYHTVRIRGEELWVIPVSRLGTYFGWSDPCGVRVQFHTHNGEHFAVTITYDVLRGRDEAARFFPLVNRLLRVGTDSVAMNLTLLAAEEWRVSLPFFRRIAYEIGLYLGWFAPRLCFDDVQIVDTPPTERIVRVDGVQVPEVPVHTPVWWRRLLAMKSNR